MDKTLYTNGVLVDANALTRTELTKAAEILRSREEFNSMGILSGGTVTAGSIYTDRVDITVFSGFTPSGEYLESTLGEFNVALSSYTATTYNYVCAVYTETNTHNKPHENNGSVYPTRAEKSYRIRVFTEADFNNPSVLPLSDANYANDAKDRCLILAKVRAEGVGNAITEIHLPTTFNNIMYTVPVTLTTITGVSVLSVDPDCPTGAGTITFDNTSAPTFNFTWTSYGGTVSGTIPVTLDSVVIITDSSGYWIELEIIVSLLPLGGTMPLTETVNVYNLYYQEIPRRSADDWLHRNMIGNGITSPNNPHGMSIDDLSGTSLSLLDEHQDVMHSNGIWSGSINPNLFACGVNGTTDPTADLLTITLPLPGDLYYINGQKLQNLTVPNLAFNTANFASGILGPVATLEETRLFEAFVHDDEVLTFHLRAIYPTSRNCTGTWIVDMSPNHPSGAYTLRMDVYNPSSPSTITLYWNNGIPLTVDHPGKTNARADFVVRLFRPNGVDWIDLYIGESGATDQYIPIPNGTYSDSITVYAPVSSDYDQYLKIASFPYWYDTTGPRGRIGIPPYGSVGTRVINDCRSYGTLGISDITDYAKEELFYKPQNEFIGSGILLNRDGYKSFSPTTATVTPYITGGPYYYRGERKYLSGSTVTCLASKVHVIYIDENNTLQTLNVTDDFGSDTDLAMEFLIGSSFWRNSQFAIDETDVSTDDYTKSEKGVPLWVVEYNGASALVATGTYCVARNLLAEPWTVGEFYPLLVNYAYGGSQFDNLRAAFLWAKLYRNRYDRYNHNIEFRLVHNSYIFTQVTQPANTKVVGTHSDAYVIISGALTSGAWVLSNACIVDNVAIWPYVTVSVGSACFVLASNTEITRCKTATGILVEPEFVFIKAAGGTAYSNVLISDNNIECRQFLADCYNASNSNITVRDNVAVQVEDLDINAFVNLGGNMIRVKDNDFTIGYGTSTWEYGVNLLASSNFYITGNVLRTVGNSSALSIVVLTNCSNGFVQSNNIIRNSGVTCVYTGVYISGTCESISIKDNKIEGANTAITGADATLTNASYISIDGNEIIGTGTDSASYSQYGINLDIRSSGTVLEGLEIKNNKISNLYYTSDVYGINVSMTSASLLFAKGLEISGNTLTSLNVDKDNSGKKIYGIYVDVNASNGAFVLSGLTINNNTITNMYNSHASNSGCFGIYVNKVAANSANNIFISGNNIHAFTSSSSHDSVGIKSEFAYSVISNNTIEMQEDFGIVVSASNTNVSNNRVYSTFCGISCVGGNTWTVDSNNVHVVSESGIGSPFGSYCIFVYSASALSGFTISNNTTLLEGSGGVLIDDSCNIYVGGLTGQSNFTVSKNSTEQNYSSLSGGTTGAYHIYLSLVKDKFVVKDNIVHNDNVPVTASAGSFGIYVTPHSSADYNGIVSHNTIYGSNRYSVSTTQTDAREELYAVGSDYTHSVTLTHNHIGLDPSRATTLSSSDLIYPLISISGCLSGYTTTIHTLDHTIYTNTEDMYTYTSPSTYVHELRSW